MVLEFIKSRSRTTKEDLLLRFSLDDEAQVRAVLRDLSESQLVLPCETGAKGGYRAASDDELLALRSTQGSEGLDDLVVALIYREGALTLAEIAQRAQSDERLIETPLGRLVNSGRVQCVTTDGVDRFEARALVIPLDAPAGWEAAVFDHFKAMVTTILGRLDAEGASKGDDRVGGSTYTIDIWPGHPMFEEVSNTLRQVRTTLSDLRQRVAEHNAQHARPQHYFRAVIYAGQRLISEGSD